MAKSTRSKVKRHFRAKKREEGVYAATEAARLQRLNLKLRTLTTSKVQQETEEDEMPVEREYEGERQDEPGAGWSPSSSSPASAFAPVPPSTESDSDMDWETENGESGLCWLSALSLVDPCDITAERMGEFRALRAFGSGSSAHRVHARGGKEFSHSECGLDHLFPGLSPGSGSGSGIDG